MGRRANLVAVRLLAALLTWALLLRAPLPPAARQAAQLVRAAA
jgi:hypothetical protein